MNTQAAQRILQVQDPVIPIIGRLAAQNPGTISLGQGVVHYSPPPSVTDRVLQSLGSNQNVHQYGDVCGVEPLIDALSHKIQNENGITDVPETASIVVTAGANMAFMNAISVIADKDDEIILLSPYYFNHQMAIEILGCRVCTVSSLRNHQPDLEAIESAITTRTRAIVTVSPNNPTGAVYAHDDLVAINNLCAKKGIFHICDEAYEYFVYDDESHFSPGSLSGASQHTISLYSMSKSYGMAGWRAGYMVIPNQLSMSVKKFQDTNLICPPRVVQNAMLGALEAGGGWCREQAQPFNEIRKRIIGELLDCKVISNLPEPKGGFYFLLGLNLKLSAMEVCKSLIERYQVATLPGSTFGDENKCSIRISYGALDSDSVLEGVSRLRNGLEQLAP